MDTSNPGPLLMLGGGVLMIIGSILNWGPSTSGLSTDLFGLLGILILLSGAAIAGLAAVRTFAPQVGLPDQIVGFSLDQVATVVGFTMFLWSFSAITISGIEIGAHLTWIGAAAATVGTVIASRKNAGAQPGNL
jgi:hypothetical protein